MVKCKRKRKYGGGLVWDKMKHGVGKWGDAGKAGIANVKAAQEKAKIEGNVLANSYKNQKANNSVPAMPAMPTAMPTMAATGGKRRRRRRTKRRKRSRSRSRSRSRRRKKNRRRTKKRKSRRRRR